MLKIDHTQALLLTALLVIQGACSGGQTPSRPAPDPPEGTPPNVSRNLNPQTVTMQIEYRGGPKHLHLTASTKPSFSKGGGQVTWNVEILPNPAQTIPQAKEVRLWFPLPDLPFLDSPGVLSGQITISPIIYGTDGIGRASILLTPNPGFPLVDNKKTVIPLAIYTDIDDGQDAVLAGPGKRKNNFHQPGVQMVDGAHSHPECEVGP